MRVLQVIPNFWPATRWGGPILSTKLLCDGLAATPGVEVSVETVDGIGPGLPGRVVPAPLPYPVHFSRRSALHAVSPGLLARLPAAMLGADVVHLTGTYNFPTLPVLTLARALGVPVVWSPRGALLAAQEWEGARRPRLKRVFERAAEALGPRALVLHATARAEAEANRARFPRARHVVVPNAIPVPPGVPRREGGGRRLMALGRLDRKKGFDLLLAAMCSLPPGVTLDLYGDGPERARLERLAAPLGGRVRFHGHVEGAAKSAAFAAAELFVMPSHSENFGLAAGEALAHGLPVLTTTGTPWGGIEWAGCGRVIDLSRDDLAEAIAEMLTRDLSRMGARGRAFVAERFSQDRMVQGFLDLYADLASSRTRRAVWA